MSKKSTQTRFFQHPWLMWGVVALFLAWIFYSLSAYYVVHKPLSLPLITSLAEQSAEWLGLDFSSTSLLRSLLDLGAAVWLSTIALGIGIHVLAWFSFTPQTNLETALFGMGLGTGLLGLGVLFMGLLGLLHSPLFYLLAIILSLLTVRPAFSWLRALKLSLPSPLITIYFILTIGLALFVALLPPTSWDALFYHLKGPKLYLEAGRIRPGVDIPHLNFPSLFEMIFAAAMAIRGDVTAKLLHFEFSFLLAGLVYSTTRQHLKVRNSWVSVLFLYGTPMFLLLASWAYNDLALAFYQMAALHTLLSWQRTRQEKWLVLSGVLCGFALSLKYTSFVAPLILAGIVIWEYRHRFSRVGRPLILLALPVLLIALPWYAKNLFFVNNPVYPFLFNGRFWDDFRAAAYAGSGTGLGFDLLALLRLPHDLTLGLQDASQDGPSGPLYLIFLPLLLFYALSPQRKRTPPTFRYLLLFVLVQYLFWTVGVFFSAGLRQSRLLLPAFVALCPVMAWIWQDLRRIDHPQFSLQRFLGLTVGLSLFLSLVGQITAWLPRAPLAYVIGTDSRSDVLRRELGVHYLVMEELNELLPAEAVVVFLWEPRSYYCERDCRPDSILDTFAHWEYLHQDATSMAAAWRQAGITHILLHDTGLQFVIDAGDEWTSPDDMEDLKSLQENHWTMLKQWGQHYTLYELNPRSM